MRNLCDVDVIVKSFNRPNCLLRLVKSWNYWYPNIPLTICDDSTEKIDFSDSDYKPHNIVNLPNVDIGISCGRNYGVKHTSKKYILFLDDDFVIHEGTKISILLDLMDIHPQVAIVAGVMGERDTNAVMQGGELTLHEGVFSRRGLGEQFEYFHNHRYRQCDIADNFFLAKRELFDDVAWDNKLKVGEHADFFLQIKNTKWKVLFTPDVTVGHDHPVLEHSSYDQYRYQRHYYYKELFWEKYNIQEERYVRHNGSIQKLWITSRTRVDFDNEGNLQPFSSKLQGYVLAKRLGSDNHGVFQILVVDKSDHIHTPGQQLVCEPSFANEIKLRGVYDNDHLYLLRCST